VNDDVEHYEEPNYKPKIRSNTTTSEFVKTNEDPKQKLRLFLLDQIQDVQDKTIKGNLLDYLFSDPIITKLSAMTNDQQKTFVETTITNMSTLPSSVVTSQETKKQHYLPDVKDYFSNDSATNISKKLDGMLTNLSQMKDNLTDIKTIFTNKKEPYTPSIPDMPELPNIEKFTEKEKDPMGYENVYRWGATLL
jgi:hypothetical protein